jgi:hypothetical protein
LLLQGIHNSALTSMGDNMERETERLQWVNALKKKASRPVIFSWLLDRLDDP